MRIGIEEAINILAERTYQNTHDINRKNLQRRHQVVDLYGVEFSRLGDAQNPAIVYISISPDMEYLERFQFKLIISPFRSSVGSMSIGGQVSVGETELTIEHDIIETPLGNDNYNLEFTDPTITPNPHTHTLSGITITPNAGITQSDIPTGTTFRVIVFDPLNPSNEVDITQMLASQYDGRWISGVGVYPSLKINHDYDILQVACELESLGLIRQRKLLTDPGYKGIRIEGSNPFGVTLVNYLKYSHLNR